MGFWGWIEDQAVDPWVDLYNKLAGNQPVTREDRERYLTGGLTYGEANTLVTDKIPLAARQIGESLIYTVPGLIELGKAFGHDLTHPTDDSQLFELVKAAGGQVAEDFRNPSENPGNLILDLFTALSLGAAAPAKAGQVGRAVSAARADELLNAPSATRAAFDALRTPAPRETITLQPAPGVGPPVDVYGWRNPVAREAIQKPFYRSIENTLQRPDVFDPTDGVTGLLTRAYQRPYFRRLRDEPRAERDSMLVRPGQISDVAGERDTFSPDPLDELPDGSRIPIGENAAQVIISQAGDLAIRSPEDAARQVEMRVTDHSRWRDEAQTTADAKLADKTLAEHQAQRALDAGDEEGAQEAAARAQQAAIDHDEAQRQAQRHERLARGYEAAREPLLRYVVAGGAAGVRAADDVQQGNIDAAAAAAAAPPGTAAPPLAPVGSGVGRLAEQIEGPATMLGQPGGPIRGRLGGRIPGTRPRLTPEEAAAEQLRLVQQGSLERERSLLGAGALDPASAEFRRRAPQREYDYNAELRRRRELVAEREKRAAATPQTAFDQLAANLPPLVRKKIEESIAATMGRQATTARRTAEEKAARAKGRLERREREGPYGREYVTDSPAVREAKKQIRDAKRVLRDKKADPAAKAEALAKLQEGETKLRRARRALPETHRVRVEPDELEPARKEVEKRRTRIAAAERDVAEAKAKTRSASLQEGEAQLERAQKAWDDRMRALAKQGYGQQAVDRAAVRKRNIEKGALRNRIGRTVAGLARLAGIDKNLRYLTYSDKPDLIESGELLQDGASVRRIGESRSDTTVGVFVRDGGRTRLVGEIPLATFRGPATVFRTFGPRELGFRRDLLPKEKQKRAGQLLDELSGFETQMSDLVAKEKGPTTAADRLADAEARVLDDLARWRDRIAKGAKAPPTIARLLAQRAELERLSEGVKRVKEKPVVQATGDELLGPALPQHAATPEGRARIRKRAAEKLRTLRGNRARLLDEVARVGGKEIGARADHTASQLERAEQRIGQLSKERDAIAAELSKAKSPAKVEELLARGQAIQQQLDDAVRWRSSMGREIDFLRDPGQKVALGALFDELRGVEAEIAHVRADVRHVDALEQADTPIGPRPAHTFGKPPSREFREFYFGTAASDNAIEVARLSERLSGERELLARAEKRLERLGKKVEVVEVEDRLLLIERGSKLTNHLAAPLPRIRGAFRIGASAGPLAGPGEPFRAKRPGARGLKKPEKGRYDTALTHQWTGGTIRNGYLTFDVAGAAINDQVSAYALLSSLETYTGYWQNSAPYRVNANYVPVMDPRFKPTSKEGKLVAEIFERSDRGQAIGRDVWEQLPVEAQRRLAHELHLPSIGGKPLVPNAKNAKGELLPLREWKIDEKLAPPGRVRHGTLGRIQSDYTAYGVRWVDQRQILGLESEMQLPPKLAWILDSINNPLKALYIYARISYVLNVAGNAMMLALDEGFASVKYYTRAARAPATMHRDHYARILQQVGEGRARSMAHTASRRGGVGARQTQAMAEWWSRHVDRHFRVAAFLYYADEIGMGDGDALGRLLMDKRHLRDLNRVRTLANKSLVQFDTLSAAERNLVRHLVFVYPWMSRASVWAMRAMIENPAKVWTMSELGQYVANQVEEELGGLPADLRRRGYAIWKRKGKTYLFATAAINSFQTLPEVTEGLADLLAGGDTSYADFATPLPSMLIQAGQEGFAGDFEGVAKAFIDTLVQTPQVSALKRAGLLPESDYSRRPAERQPIFQERSALEAIGPIAFSTLYPREANVPALKARAKREEREALSTTEKARQDTEARLRAIVTSARAAGLIDGRAPEPIQRGLRSYRARNEAYAEKAQSLGVPLSRLRERERLAIDVRLAREAGISSGWIDLLLDRRRRGYMSTRTVRRYLSDRMGEAALASLSASTSAIRRRNQRAR